MNNTISAKYSIYSIKQVRNNDKCDHSFYKNGIELFCRSVHCYPRSSKKQLYRYLRYLVDSKTINNIFKAKNNNYPYDYNEVTNEVKYCDSYTFKKSTSIDNDGMALRTPPVPSFTLNDSENDTLEIADEKGFEDIASAFEEEE